MTFAPNREWRTGRWQSQRAAATRMRHSLLLLTERRMLLFACLDLLLLLAGVLMGLNSDTANARAMWLPFFIMPVMLVGVPMLADTVAVERRSGTLDLALTSPGARFYFERRVLSVCVLIVAQGWIAMTLTRFLLDGFPLSGPFLQAISVALFAGAVTLHWAVRLRTAGAVIFATYLTALVFSPWLFSIPVHTPDSMNGPMTAIDLWHWAQDNLVLLSCALVFYAYARQRLMRPELVIT